MTCIVFQTLMVMKYLKIMFETQENEEIYRFNLNADTHPSNEYTQDLTRLPSLRCEEHTRRRVVHKELEGVRLLHICLVEAQELMFEVLQLVIEEDDVRKTYTLNFMQIWLKHS
ncbi:hypothetical protein Bca52824_042367 [Brassica carinata]|uniref:Uncharacterized protein n=1 Tax=Brassica carinata TaxID=52824 RepID=A0A8X7RY97_BRACI|nr:hypothetical protein Bca52824_042367 [Brassica carinata]